MRHKDFLATRIALFAVRDNLGVVRRLFILQQFLKSLGISSPFSSCLRPASCLGRGKQQRFQSNSQGKQSTLCKKRKPAPNRASKSKTTRRKPLKKIACGETDRTSPPPTRLRRIRTRTIFFACGEKNVRHMKSLVRQTTPCLGHVVKRTGITIKRAPAQHVTTSFTPDQHYYEYGYESGMLGSGQVQLVHACRIEEPQTQQLRSLTTTRRLSRSSFPYLF